MAGMSARELAYQKLRHRIIHMELKPGDALNDRMLAEEMGISRTPVREALIMLNIAHMVVIKPQSGTHVAPIDLELMGIEQFTRYTLEKEMLARCAANMNAQRVEAYRQNIEAYRACSSKPATPARLEKQLALDNQFHRMAFVFEGRTADFDYVMAAFQHIERLRMFSLMMAENEYVSDDHAAILQMLVSRDTGGLCAALQKHLTRYKRSVAEAMKRNPEYFTGRLQV